MWWERIKEDRDITQMIMADFETAFLDEYYHLQVTERHYQDLLEFRQGNLSVDEAVRKFNRLAHLCPDLVKNDRERVRLMLTMFKPDIALIVTAGGRRPTTASECLTGALMAEHYLKTMNGGNTQPQ